MLPWRLCLYPRLHSSPFLLVLLSVFILLIFFFFFCNPLMPTVSTPTVTVFLQQYLTWWKRSITRSLFSFKPFIPNSAYQISGCSKFFWMTNIYFPSCILFQMFYVPFPSFYVTKAGYLTSKEKCQKWWNCAGRPSSLYSVTHLGHLFNQSQKTGQPCDQLDVGCKDLKSHISPNF